MRSEDSASSDPARDELAAFGRRLAGDGLAVGSAGNLSCRLGESLVITPSGIPYAELVPGDMWVLGPDGSEEEGGRSSPSSESPLHLAVYEATGAGAVVHTHSPEVVALSCVSDHLPAIHYAIAQLGGPVRVVGYARFGSGALASATALAFEGRSAAILQNHGAVTCGRTLAEAYERALLLEWLAGVYRRARQLGTPRILSQGELDEVVAEARRRRYGEGRAGS